MQAILYTFLNRQSEMGKTTPHFPKRRWKITYLWDVQWAWDSNIQKKKRAWKEKFSSVKTLIIIHLEETNGKSYLFVAGFYFTWKHNKPFLLPFHLSKFHILKSWHLVIKLKGNLTSHQCIVWMEIEWAATLGSRWLLFNPLHLRFHAARLWESCAQNHLVY